jgi:oxygen tolerance protein BatD
VNRRQGPRRWPPLLLAIGCLVALGSIVPRVAAEDIEFRAEVDRETLSLDDSLTLTLRLSGQLAQVPNVELGNIPDFDAYSGGQSQRMNIVNGQMSVESIQQFELHPKKVGQLQIPSFSVNVGGNVHSTQPIAVTVTETPRAPEVQTPASGGESVPSGGGDVELQATASPEQVFVGQQVTYRLRVFRRVQWSDVGLDNVKFDGFWVEELGNSGSEKRSSKNGQLYLYQDLLYALFPSVPGPHPLEPRTLHYSRLTGNDLFFAIPQPAPPVQSNAVSLEILPVPEEGRPAKFSGAVGSLQIAAQVDRAEARQDQAVTLTVIVSGVGNPNTFPQPALQLPDSIEAFETQSDVYVNKKRELIAGSHTFKTVLVPRKPGPFTLGPFELWTFDPYKKSFEHIQSDPVVLKVEKGREGPTSTAAQETSRREDLRLLTEDIRYLKPNDSDPAPYRGPVILRPLFWGVLLFPLAALVGLAALQRFRGRLSTDVGFRRRHRALRLAQGRLVAAAKSTESVEACRLLEMAIVGYVSDWLNLPPSVTQEDLLDRLQRGKVSAKLLEKLVAFLRRCAFLRFARAEETSVSKSELVTQGEALLAELQREVVQS